MRYILMIFTLFFIIGCGPKYKVQKEYIASNLGSNNSCLNSCQNAKSFCDINCKSNYDMCMKKAQSEAQVLYNKSLSSYEKEKIRYDNDLRRYDIQKRRYDSLRRDLKYDISHFKKKCRRGGKDAAYVCDRYNSAKHKLDVLEDHRPVYPRYPNKPRLYDILNQVQSRCSNDCGCEQKYDICFSQCGGEIKYHKICVENCD